MLAWMTQVGDRPSPYMAEAFCTIADFVQPAAADDLEWLAAILLDAAKILREPAT